MIENALRGPLAGLVAYPQFLLWSVFNEKKVPIDPITGVVCDPHDASKWVSAEVALARLPLVGAKGVAFVLANSDPFVFVDVDDCLINGQWSTTANEMCATFPGAAVEVSSGGEGLHLIFKSTPPPHGCKNVHLGLEFYHTKRFVALTGTHASGDVNLTFDTTALVSKYFPPGASAGSGDWQDGPVDGWNGPTDDVELLEKMAASGGGAASVFGGKATFAELWNADGAALAKYWPAVDRKDGRQYDASHADAALCQRLAFWTGNDCPRMERLMWQSKLVRDKWTYHKTYLERTILNAVSQQTDFYKAKVEELAPTTVTEVTMVDPFVTVAEQIELFKNFTYVTSMHRVMVERGRLLKPEQFKVRFGSKTYAYGNDGKCTKDAWEAYSNQPGVKYPMADFVAFKPQLPPGKVFSAGGNSYVNSYFPIEVPRLVGDVSLFFLHLTKVLPDKRDQAILLSYMAACVQHKGVKFQWAPLLQGVEGNGKTLFTRCVAHAIGEAHVHWPKASKLGKDFNGWMTGKLLFAVEDIYVPTNKREIIEDLKPMITGGDGLEIERKGIDQTSEDICGNFMFNTNHRDSGTKSKNDRRFCVFFTAQQKEEDLLRDGMKGDYFPTLYTWLKYQGGYAMVSEFLYTFPIPDEFNPATYCQRAPITSTTEQAIAANMGVVEQEILEAIEQGKPGFCGGFISSIALEKLLENSGHARRISRAKRKDILESLGYVYHPALNDGRMSQNSMIDGGGRPRLFVDKTSENYNLKDSSQVSITYTQLNNGVPFDIGK